jgi:hypothetical protein
MRVVQIDENNQIIGKPFIMDFKVICVADDKHLSFPKGKLTKGKVYDVVSVQPIRDKYRSNINKGISHYRIIDDSGEKNSYSHSDFVKINY